MATAQLKRKPRPADAWSRPVQQARSRETRDRLFAAGERVFEEKGYEGARIADIAREAGCSVGAVYVRFEDKDALFAGIVDAFAAESAARIAEAVRDSASEGPAAFMRRYIRDMAKLFATHKGLFRAIMERSFGNEAAMKPIVAMRARMATIIEDVLRPALARKRTDVPLAVRVVTQMVFGFLFNTVLNPISPTRNEGPRAIAELELAVLRYLELE
jgi:AcrR family transcriptional regulator